MPIGIDHKDFLKEGTIDEIVYEKCSHLLNGSKIVVSEQKNHVLKKIKNNISNNSNRGINVHDGSILHMWCDQQLTSATTISGNSEAAIQAGLNSTLNLCNLTLTSPNTGIRGSGGSSIHLENVTITGSTEYGLRTGGSKIYADNSTIISSTNSEIKSHDSTINLVNTAITGTAGNEEIKLNYGSMLFIDNGTTITGTVYCDASVDNNSIGNWANLTLTRSGC